MEKTSISIFQKHLGSLEATEQINQDFIRNTHNINEAIGALQVIDLTLKKCLSLGEDSQAMLELICNATFMGTAIFDQDIQVCLSSQSRQIAIRCIADTLTNNHPATLNKFLSQKREEIAEFLDWLMDLMQIDDIPSTQTSYQQSMTLSKNY
ncbi:hypothetical protein BBW65_06370 [Helicobacter enhydrae]|uniref:Uncharacterized protein n=1 Tax=Helicobacter enhydrae TaxID=222136 RepID=A0A1B1U6X2_9HELI|nr:flagellar FLiS export co-chaperone [Helicobacter enhydrae]ANV98442.1 hypothetical protein BBW65_06370 [Helicobacter enhydrae]